MDIRLCILVLVGLLTVIIIWHCIFAKAASEGFTPDGGMIYEKLGEEIDGDPLLFISI